MVSIVRIEGERVRIGIDAPPDVRVIRSELLAAVADENLRAARPTIAAASLAALRPGLQA